MVTADDMAEAVRDTGLRRKMRCTALPTLLEGPPRVVGGREAHRRLSRVLADFGQALTPLMDDEREGE